MERADDYCIDNQQTGSEGIESILEQIRKIMDTYPVSYSNPHPGGWEYTYRPSGSTFYNRVLNKSTPQPEDDEGMSDDDLKESQKMLFDFLGVTE